MQTNGNTGERRNAFTGPRLNELGSAEFRSIQQGTYEALKLRHNYLFTQYEDLFQPQHPVVMPASVGNLAATAYDQRQNATMEAMAHGAMGTSGLRYDSQPQPAYDQTSSVPQVENAPQREQMRPDDPVTLARAKIEAVTSDPSYVEPMPNLGDEPAIQAYADQGMSQFEELLMLMADSESQSEVASA